MQPTFNYTMLVFFSQEFCEWMLTQSSRNFSSQTRCEFNLTKVWKKHKENRDSDTMCATMTQMPTWVPIQHCPRAHIVKQDDRTPWQQKTEWMRTRWDVLLSGWGEAKGVWFCAFCLSPQMSLLCLWILFYWEYFPIPLFSAEWNHWLISQRGGEIIVFISTDEDNGSSQAHTNYYHRENQCIPMHTALSKCTMKPSSRKHLPELFQESQLYSDTHEQFIFFFQNIQYNPFR